MRALFALGVLVLAQAAAADPPCFVDYLYVEANEGGSSGGHAAIRFGDETYHFQHEPGGLLRLRRDDSQEFRHRYGELENRTMHASRIAVTGEGYRRLRRQFNERYLRERKLFAHQGELHDDRDVLALLLARRRGDTAGTIPLRGAGFFYPERDGAPSSTTLRALRERIERAYGPDVLRRRAAQVRRDLAVASPTADAVDGHVPDAGYPDFATPYSVRYRDLLVQLAAIDVLDRALALRPDARRTSDDPDFLLDDARRRALGAFADRLADALVRLAGSSRPDWGFALLVGMARLQALAESERTGHLVLLDAFPPDSAVIPSPRRRQLGALRGLVGDARTELARARDRLDDGLAEDGFTRLEAAGNRVLELEGAVEQGSDLRVAGTPLLPSREAPWRDLVVPDATDAELARALAAATAAAERFAGELRQRFGYDLVTHNCVSELFRTVDDSGVDMGGHLGAWWSLEFVPFVSSHAVDATWDVVEQTTQRSYRQARLEEMTEREGWRAWLRESNVLTSTIYPGNDEDSAFLWFTDDVVAPRPLLGAANVAVGVGAGVAGIALLPFDGGRLLGSGLRGVVYSLPELAFVNLRKGSFDWVPTGDGVGGHSD